ncbi:hypothetical protein Tco_0424315 [Tanacetum coccineum]
MALELHKPKWKFADEKGTTLFRLLRTMLEEAFFTYLPPLFGLKQLVPEELFMFYNRLPEDLSGVHDTFHVSNLKKCLADASLHVPLNEIKVDKTLHFTEEPVEILDCEIKSLKRSKISLEKVHWDSKHGPESTWEREDYMKSKYPH